MKNLMTLLVAMATLTAFAANAQQPTGKEAVSPTAPVTPEINSPLPSNSERVPEKMLKKSPLNNQNDSSAESMVRKQQFQAEYKAATNDKQRQDAIRKYNGGALPAEVKNSGQENKPTVMTAEEKERALKAKTARGNDKREKAFSNKFNRASSDEKVSMCRQMRERCDDGKSNSCIRIDEYCKSIAKDQ
jgi:hypothetical protein